MAWQTRFWVVASVWLVHAVASAQAAPPPPLPNAATYAAIRDRALASDWAFERLADLTDLIGPRISGSPQAQAAIEQVAQAMRNDGLKVTLQPMRTPHWVRGEERGELVDYAQRPKGITQQVQLTALGGSVATPPEGITAPVLVVRNFADLTTRAKEARGKIVVFDYPFDQELAENGQAGPAYGQAVAYRVAGASVAAKLGAVAALVRGVGGAHYRLKHTGMLAYEANAPKIPAAALTTEDTMLIARLAKRGPVTLKLVLTPQNLSDANSFNVLGDYLGSQKPEEIVLVSGHLDSWDLGTGAIDDGAGVAVAMGVAHVLKELKLKPRRTIRVVAWMSEENGAHGGRPYGLEAYATLAAMKPLAALRDVLIPIGVTALHRTDRPIGADINAWQAAGVPGLEVLVDGRHYFDYHHTQADTLDKVDPQNLQRMVASLAVLTYFLADSAEPLPRVPAQPE